MLKKISVLTLSISLLISSVCFAQTIVNPNLFEVNHSIEFNLSNQSNISAASTGDQYEPNNTFATSTTVSSTNTYATIHSQSDIDFFNFVVPKNNSRVSILLLDRPNGTNYDFEVFDSSYTKIYNPQDPASSTVEGKDGRRCFFKIMDSGTYYVKVYSKSGSSSNEYKLSISKYEPALFYEIGAGLLSLKCVVSGYIGKKAIIYSQLQEIRWTVLG